MINSFISNFLSAMRMDRLGFSDYCVIKSFFLIIPNVYAISMSKEWFRDMDLFSRVTVSISVSMMLVSLSAIAIWTINRLAKCDMLKGVLPYIADPYLTFLSCAYNLGRGVDIPYAIDILVQPYAYAISLGLIPAVLTRIAREIFAIQSSKSEEIINGDNNEDKAKKDGK